MTNATLVNALVKLRHRIDGQDVTLTQAEAQALYIGVMRHASREHLAYQEYAEQIQPRVAATTARVGHPYGVAVRQTLGWDL
jgi:hypothetical protein